MAYAVLFIRLLISGVFLISGVAKTLDFRGARVAARNFGAPHRISGFVAGSLIGAELLIGVLLLFNISARIGAAASFALLAIFVIAISRLLFRGETPDCHCFGQIQTQPVGKSLLVRNFVLLGLSLFLVLVPVFEIDFVAVFLREMSGISAVSALFGLFLVTIGALLAVIPLMSKLRGSRDKLADLNASDLARKGLENQISAEPGLPVGAGISEFELIDMNGETLSLHSVLQDGLPVLVVFVGPNCVPCGALADNFEEWAIELEEKARVLLISDGGHALNMEKFGTVNCSRMLLQRNNAANEAFNVRWTPAAVVLGRNQRIASRSAFGDSAMRELVAGLAGADEEQPLIVGAADEPLFAVFGKKIPEFELAKLDGGIVSHTDFTGRKTLIVFWSLSCTFCEEILAEIKRSRLTSPGLNLYVFADGEMSQLKAAGISEFLVHDPADRVSKALGKQGTPSAILVDERGIIISETAQGVSRIRMLASTD